jgi:hypothetical protein
VTWLYVRSLLKVSRYIHAHTSITYIYLFIYKNMIISTHVRDKRVCGDQQAITRLFFFVCAGPCIWLTVFYYCYGSWSTWLNSLVFICCYFGPLHPMVPCPSPTPPLITPDSSRFIFTFIISNNHIGEWHLIISHVSATKKKEHDFQMSITI